jgi:hypothetical protein
VVEMTGFIATEISFCGEPGYVVKQYINGKVVVSQFIPKDGYDGFCRAIGMKPEIVKESEVEL